MSGTVEKHNFSCSQEYTHTLNESRMNVMGNFFH